jgi:hypothetical protein
MRINTFSPIIIIIAIMSLFYCGTVYAQDATANNQSTNDNNNLLSIGISSPPEVTVNIRTSPNVPSVPYTELPSYFGPFGKTWNDQSSSILPFLLMHKRTFKAYNTHRRFRGDVTFSKVNITTMKKDWIGKSRDNPEYIKVVNGIEEIRGIRFVLVGTITTYGKRKTTTVNCFDQAIVETSKLGANTFLLLATSASFGIHSTTIGFGSSGAGNFSQGGKEAFSGGIATGFASNTGGPTSNPYVHGVALFLTRGEISRLRNKTLPSIR